MGKMNFGTQEQRDLIQKLFDCGCFSYGQYSVTFEGKGNASNWRTYKPVLLCKEKGDNYNPMTMHENNIEETNNIINNQKGFIAYSALADVTVNGKLYLNQPIRLTKNLYDLIESDKNAIYTVVSLFDKNRKRYAECEISDFDF